MTRTGRIGGMLFAVALCVSGGLLAGAPDAAGPSCTVTAQAGPISVKDCDFFLVKKKDGIFVFWNSLDYHDALEPFGDNGLSRTAQGLVEGPGLARYPHAKRFHVTVAEVAGRDAYGLPRWDNVKVVLRLDYAVDKKGHVASDTGKP